MRVSFIRNCQTLFQSGSTFSYCLQECVLWASFFASSPMFDVTISALYVGSDNFIVVLVCIFLIANVEQPFTCWPCSFSCEASVCIFCEFSDWIVWVFFCCFFFLTVVLWAFLLYFIFQMLVICWICGSKIFYSALWLVFSSCSHNHSMKVFTFLWRPVSFSF